MTAKKKRTKRTKRKPEMKPEPVETTTSASASAGTSIQVEPAGKPCANPPERTYSASNVAHEKMKSFGAGFEAGRLSNILEAMSIKDAHGPVPVLLLPSDFAYLTRHIVARLGEIGDRAADHGMNWKAQQ